MLVVYLLHVAYKIGKIKDLFGIAFDELKSVFNTQKACLKRNNIRLVKKIKAFLRV